MSKLRVSSFAISIDAGIDLPALGYECVKHVAGVRAMHVFPRRRTS